MVLGSGMGGLPVDVHAFGLATRNDPTIGQGLRVWGLALGCMYTVYCVGIGIGVRGLGYSLGGLLIELIGFRTCGVEDNSSRASPF